MPTYQYRCTECGHDLEVVQKFSDPSLTVCPNCQGALRKVFNAVGVVFKGTGFYRTDSRGPDTSANSGSGSSEKSSESGSDSSKSSTSSSTSDSSKPGATKSTSGAKSDGSGSGGTKPSGSGTSSSGGSAKAAATS